MLSPAGTNAGAKVIQFPELTTPLQEILDKKSIRIGIGDVPEEQCVPGHRCAGGAAVFTFDDLAEFFYGHLVAADFDESANDGAYHVAQETVGSDGKYPLVALTGPLGALP